MLYKYIFDPTATNPDGSSFTNNLVVGDLYVLTNQMGESIQLQLKGFSRLVQHPVFQLMSINLPPDRALDIYLRLGEFNLFNGIKVVNRIEAISGIDRETYLQENKEKLLEIPQHWPKVLFSSL